MRPTAILCIVSAAMLLPANVVVVLKSPSKSKGAWAVAAVIVSKWQPMYFIAVSAQRIISRAIVIPNGVICPLNEDNEVQIEAATFLWDCIILSIGISAIASDMQNDHTPARRRCIYCFLALCLILDVIGSYIWGNTLVSQVSVSFGFFNILMENQITSSITSQVIIALHFFFVSCRSRSGRGWAYAPLRFELDECGKASLSKLNFKEINHDVRDKITVASGASAKTPMLETEGEIVVSQNGAEETLSIFLRLRRRLSQFQKRHLSRCRVFVIPCVAYHEVEKNADVDFALARPAFDFRFVRPLQRLADAHPKSYFGLSFCFFGVPSMICEFTLAGEARGISVLFFNSGLFTTLLGFLSSRRYGLDRVAVKHVASSFRFATCVALSANWIAQSARLALIGAKGYFEAHPTNTAALSILCLFLLGCFILDCSPHTPASIQICIAVMIASCSICNLRFLTFLAGRGDRCICVFCFSTAFKWNQW